MFSVEGNCRGLPVQPVARAVVQACNRVTGETVSVCIDSRIRSAITLPSDPKAVYDAILDSDKTK